MHIKVATHKPDLTKKQKFYMVPSRWLHELYPVDEIVSAGARHRRRRSSASSWWSRRQDIYTVEATDGSGRVVHTARSAPSSSTREYLDKFPGWSHVEVTTGWLTATIDGKPVIDARIQTDPERFWDHYQSKVLPRIYDHVMKVTDNRPLPDEAAVLPRPRRGGVDERAGLPHRRRRGADLVARITARRPLLRHARLLRRARPHDNASSGWRPRQDLPRSSIPNGAASPARCACCMRATPRPRRRMEIRYREKGGQAPEKVNRDLGKIDTTAPVAARSVVRADACQRG